jgi:predicted MFS family arabinose efflux permease
VDTVNDTVAGHPPLRRNRDYQLLWVGSAISLLGSRASSIAYPLLVLAMTGSATKAGIVGFAAMLPSLVLQLPLGSLADTWHRRRVLIWCDLGRLTLLAAVAVTVALGSAPIAWLAVAVFLEGSLTVLGDAVEPGALRQLVPEEQFPFAFAQQETRNRAAVLLGQPLGGALFGVGRVVPFAADAASYLASLVSLLLIRRPLQDERERAATASALSRREISRGLSWLWARPFLRMTCLLVAASNFLFQILTLALIVSATDQGASGFVVGLIIAGSGLGGILGAAVAPRVNRRLSLKGVILATHWAWAIFMPLFIFVDSPLAYSLIFAALAFVGPLWNVSVMSARVAATPDDLQGRVSSGSKVITFGVIPLGSLLGGFALDQFGSRTTFICLAAFMLLLALIATVAPSVRMRPDATARDVRADPPLAEPSVRSSTADPDSTGHREVDHLDD